MDCVPPGSKYYQENYRDYLRQNPRRKLRYYVRVLEAHFCPTAPRRIHDLGCGFGGFLAELGHDWAIHGSDVNEFAIARASERCPRGAFRVASALDPDVFGQAFGAVTAFDVLEHVPDLEAVAAAVNAQLAPNGCFIFVVPVYDGLTGPIIRWLDHDTTHVHRWPRAQWLEWANAHFQVLEWTGILRYLVLSTYYVHLVTRLFRSHTSALLVACRKQPDVAAGGRAAAAVPESGTGGTTDEG